MVVVVVMVVREEDGGGGGSVAIIVGEESAPDEGLAASWKSQSVKLRSFEVVEDGFKKNPFESLTEV